MLIVLAREYGVVELSGEQVRVFVSEQPGSDIVQAGLLPANLDTVLSADPDPDGDVVFKALSVSGDNSPGQQLIITDPALAMAPALGTNRPAQIRQRLDSAGCSLDHCPPQWPGE